MEPEEEYFPEEGGAARYISGPDDALYNEGLNQINTLIEESNLPPKIKTLFWGFFNKATIYANNSEADIRIFKERGRQFILKIQARMPADKKTPDIMRDFDNIEMMHEKWLNRSKGGFERKSLYTRSMESTINRPTEERNPGMLGRIFGR